LKTNYCKKHVAKTFLKQTNWTLFAETRT